MVAAELHNLAYVELHDGDLGRARQLFEQARAEARRLGYDALSPYLVADRAVLAAEDGDFARAATLLGAAQAGFHAAGQVPDPDDAAEHEQLHQRLAVQLGEDRLAALCRNGARASLEDALTDE